MQAGTRVWVTTTIAAVLVTLGVAAANVPLLGRESPSGRGSSHSRPRSSRRPVTWIES